MKRRRILFILQPLLLVALCVVPALQSRLHGQDRAAKIDELMERYHKIGLFNGSVLVAEKSAVKYKSLD